MRRLPAVLLAVAIGLGPGAAAADDAALSIRRLRFAERDGMLVVSGSYTDVFDRALLDQLSSGFATTVVIRIFVFRRGVARPVAFAAATARVVYDLWEERYLVRVHDPRGERSFRRARRAEALQDLTTMVDLPPAPLERIPIGAHFFAAFVVEVNPVSQEVLADVRRWLARSAGPSEAAGNASFFGSFVSLFVNPKIDEAERTLRFRSQLFFRVTR
jgi:hypothetical protein